LVPDRGGRVVLARSHCGRSDQRHLRRDHQLVHPENFDHYFRQFRRTADAQTKIALGVRTSFGESFSELAPLLSSLKTPTLLLFGEADRIVPPATGERFHELLSNSRLIKIPGCGDFPQEEFPEVVADEICTFLTEGLERAAEGG
ncbi:MAG: alpha/beta hydrolase, partial [Myxococcota bacterium]